MKTYLAILFIALVVGFTAAEDVLITREQLGAGFNFLHRGVFQLWGAASCLGEKVSKTVLGHPVGQIVADRIADVSAPLATQLSASLEELSKTQKMGKEKELKRGEEWVWRRKGTEMHFWSLPFWWKGIMKQGLLGLLWSEYNLNITTPDGKPYNSLKISVGQLDDADHCITMDKTSIALSTWHQFWQRPYWSIDFSPFATRCVKVQALTNTKLSFELTSRKHICFPLNFILGAVVFAIAPVVAGSLVLCMIAGGVIGACMVAFAICFIIYRHTLKDSGIVGLGLFAIPVAMTAYGFHEFFNFQSVWDMLCYHWWIWYLMIAGFVIAATYVYINPPEDNAQNVISLSIRLLGLYLIAQSTSSRAVSCALSLCFGIVGFAIVFLMRDS